MCRSRKNSTRDYLHQLIDRRCGEMIHKNIQSQRMFLLYVRQSRRKSLMIWVRTQLGKDKKFPVIEDQTTCAFTIIATLMSEVRKATDAKMKQDFSRQFGLLSDSARPLLSAHKDLSQARRESLRTGTSKEYRILCSGRQNENIHSDELLFGDDMGKRAEEGAKTRRI